MAKQKPPKAQDDPYLITIKDGDEERGLALYNTALEEAPRLFRAISSNIYQDVYSPNISIRDAPDRLDYDFLRPSERIPVDEKGKIAACLAIYDESGMGIVRNIVDLMADLVVQGVDVVHSKLKNEKFAKRWFHQTVKGPHFSERFTNMLCRSGNNIVKRDTSIISLKQIRKFYSGQYKADDTDVNSGLENQTALDERFQRSNEDGDKVIDKELDQGVRTETVVIKREIPVHYNLLNPLFIDIYSPELAMFIDNTDIQFGLAVPMETVRKIQNPISDHDKALVNLIPENIVNSVRNSQSQLIPLDNNKVDAYYYKKDDWKIWATPMIYGVLADLYALRKMKLADLCALDGALSQIRIWKIGDLDKKIRPSAAAFNRLASILTQGVAGGILELMWGPDIECQELEPKSYEFLGQSKYEPVLNAIYSGLGVPPLFTGVTQSGSFTSNFLAIKTFIVRLEYLRERLRSFWGKELGLLAQALGWDEPAQLVFDRMTLNDEASILQIMLHMVDRGILSDEHMQDMIGAVPNIEKTRLKREKKARDKKDIAPKAGPYHKNAEEIWIDSFIKMGEVTPSQVGLDLEPKAKGEKTPNQNKVDLGIQGPLSKTPPIGVGGRPLGKKDSTKRKPKTVKLQRGVGNIDRFVDMTLKASTAQDKISEILTPKYLELLGKKNLRQLTEEESDDFENFKFAILANIELADPMEESELEELLTKGEIETPEMVGEIFGRLVVNYKETHNNICTIDIKRRLQALAIAAFNGEYQETDNENEYKESPEQERQEDDAQVEVRSGFDEHDEVTTHQNWVRDGSNDQFADN